MSQISVDLGVYRLLDPTKNSEFAAHVTRLGPCFLGKIFVLRIWA